MRVALLAGTLAFMMSAVLGPLGLIALAAGGFFAVYLYRRRTGAKITVANGARLGWISGIFVFAIAIFVFTVQMVTLSLPAMVQNMREQMTKMVYSATEVQINQVITFLASPSGIGTIVLFSFLVTLLTALGGAVGAKLLNRRLKF